MFRTLRAVGERVPLGAPQTSIDEIWPTPDKWAREWFESGTAALAAACASAVAKYPSRSTGMSPPEIIVPAYTCPDVISAVRYAGAIAVLCDFEPGKSRLSKDHIRSLISSRTVAIIAVNFQGIPENVSGIADAARSGQVDVIYDCCQGFPADKVAMTVADLVVHSFGRGKPASAFGGGALLYRRDRSKPDVWAGMPQTGRIAGKAKVALYNFLIRPALFGLPMRIPFLGVGNTRFKALSEPKQLNPGLTARIAVSIHEHQKSAKYRADVVRQYRAALPSKIDLAAACNVCASADLLRFPILMPTEASRNIALGKLQSEQLGASRMYPGVLPEIQGMPRDAFVDGRWPVAKDFDSRLLTLPVHTDVNSNDIARITAMVNDACSQILT